MSSDVVWPKGAERDYADTSRSWTTCSAATGRLLTCRPKIPIAENSDESDNNERRKSELAPWKKERRREQQQSDRRKKGERREARTAPREDGGDDIGATPHQCEERRERGGIGTTWQDGHECSYPHEGRYEKRTRHQHYSKRSLGHQAQTISRTRERARESICSLTLYK